MPERSRDWARQAKRDLKDKKLQKKGEWKMHESLVLRKNPNMVTRVIEDETILLPIYKTSDEINCIYTLNRVASRVWEIIDGKKTLTKIKRQLLEEFDATPEEIDREMKNFLKDLTEIKAVK